MFDVLVYLFEYYSFDADSLNAGQDALSEELLGAGFLQEEVESAFTWLQGLMQAPLHAHFNKAHIHSSVRLFSREECSVLGMDGVNLLYRLENKRVLNAFTREVVIERILAIQTSKVGLEKIRWVVSTVLQRTPELHETEDWLDLHLIEDAALVLH